MKRQEIEDDLPMLIVHRDQVVGQLDARPSKNQPVKVSRGMLVDTYLETRNLKETARRCGVSVATAYQLMAKAIFCARRCAGFSTVPELDELGEDTV